MTVAGSLDTNALLRLILNDVPDQHEAVLRLTRSAGGKQFMIADTVIIELVFALGRYYHFNRNQIAEVVGALADLAELRCNRELFARALPLFETHPKLSFEDCCLAIYAELAEARPLWTFDRKLANQAPGTQLIDA